MRVRADMRTKQTEQQVVDRAREWVGVEHPDLEGEAFEAKLEEAIADLEALDEAADAA